MNKMEYLSWYQEMNQRLINIRDIDIERERLMLSRASSIPTRKNPIPNYINENKFALGED